MSLSRLLPALPIALAGSLLIVFQNCAKSIESTEVPTEVDAITALHVDHEHGTVETMQKTDVETRSDDLMSDRVLLMAQLTAVFGPATATADDDGIRTNLSVFGSPCSLYENYLWETKDSSGKTIQTAGDPLRPCTANNSANALKATLYPQASVVRQGVLEHICLKLATTTTTLRFALAQIDSAHTPEPTAANVLKAFRLFYRNAPEPPESLIASLQVMMPGVTEGNPTEDKDWSPVFHTICVSSGWQLL